MEKSSYESIGILLRTHRYVVSRGVRRSDGVRVLLKTAAAKTPADSAGLRDELELLGWLQLGGVPTPIELARDSGRDYLVMEDRGLESLRSRLDASPLAIEEFLAAAIGLARAVADLHDKNLVIGTLSPASILMRGGSSDVQILDLAMAQRAPVGASALSGLALASESAVYVAPEQTGRIDRPVDQRADLYSLGVIFYEMLVGRPPFESTDPLELVHAHLARTARPPSAMVTAIPEQVSRIVMRLLAKAVEDRYQGARGLLDDLERCRRDWQAKSAITPFELGARDYPSRLAVPHRLYGRDGELKALATAFDDTLAGMPGLVLVGGPAGIGKTAFINEFCRSTVRDRGYFVSGKFDQVARNIPYHALVQAFRGLIRQVLADRDERLAAWRAELTRALGANAGVIAAVIPEIEFIIGRQPPPIALDALESQNRFRYVLRTFVGTFARTEHPLVVFLDDLQWADTATLELLQPLVAEAEPHALLVIGAYRDAEIDANHPLTAAIEHLERERSRVHRVVLGPLDHASLVTLLAETLRCEGSDVERLAALIRHKTAGNPFFVIQFLENLGHEGLLTLDRARGRWVFHLDAIDQAATTDNVAALLTQRIERLSDEAQQVLRLAACVGNPFSRTTVVAASRLATIDVQVRLDEAARAGLIRPVVSPGEEAARTPCPEAYAFLHDRVQQAAYAQIAEEDRPARHLELGRQMVAECGGDIPDDRLFAIVNHLNVGRPLIADPEERRTLSRLNLAAARQAKNSSAYRVAVDHLAAGLDACGDARWDADYALLFPLHLERAECLHLAGDFGGAERAQADLLAHARTTVDQAAVYELRVTSCENRSQYVEAIASGRKGLTLFGVTFPDDDAAVEAAVEVEREAIQRLLGGRAIGSLVDLPMMSNEEIRAAMRLLTQTWAPVYISGNQRLTSLISATMVRLSLQHGNVEDSAYGYVTHAITVGPVRRQFAEAFEWGELAIAVNERFGDTRRRAKIHQQIHAHVKLWRKPFEACIPHAREAARAGLEAGDFAYAGYGAATESWPALLASRDLAQFLRDYTPSLGFLVRINMLAFRDVLQVMLNWALALQGRTTGPISLSNEQLDEAAFVERYSSSAPLLLTILRSAKLHLCVVSGETELGLVALEQARQSTIPGTMWPVLQEFWGALAMAAAYDDAEGAEREDFRSRIAAASRSLDELAGNCPENFRCCALLVAAECARIEGARPERVLSLYSEAVAYATATRNVQLEGLASDFCARALLRLGDTAAAREYAARAHSAYAVWGAAGTLRQLRRRFAALLPPPEDSSTDAAAGLSTADEPVLAALDVRSVLKVAHAVASEVEIETLQRTLLTIAIENAGAERGVFYRVRDEDVMPVLQADAENERVEVRRHAGTDAAGTLADAVVRYVRRTRQDVVISDASGDERFASHAGRTTAARSVLCVPVAHQGRLGGILHLEHRLRGAFTAARTELVRVLAAQAAIAFENAQLYDGMKQEIERRASAERALREALAEVEALKNRLEAENVYLQEEIGTQHNFNEIIGNSPPLLDALRRVERVAPTDSTVLILGETGSGKELVARAVHSRSRRNDRPLVKVNCGAIAPGLVESELFGHVKGAFTGAIDKRIGRFELAHGGTIFLDEIGELPLEAQVKLLRVLQEQEFEPVGSSRTVRVSVRVIAATNRNLEQAVGDGRFRADLLYRLNVFPIEIPPLRQRVSDLPLLVGFFLSKTARTLGKPLHGVTCRSMEQIQRYAWPGNVRELQNVLERAAILAQGPIVDVEPAFAGGATVKDTVIVPRAGNLADVQREHILAVLQSTGGVVEGAKGAAVILGVHPNTLRSRMKKLGIRAAGRTPHA